MQLMGASIYFSTVCKCVLRAASCNFSVSYGTSNLGKVYFAASIRAGREDANIYAELIEYVKFHCHVLSESEQVGPNIDQEAKGNNH